MTAAGDPGQPRRENEQVHGGSGEPERPDDRCPAGRRGGVVDTIVFLGVSVFRPARCRWARAFAIPALLFA
jgi:hypothetical protein